MENHGALVGWAHHDHGDGRLLLRIETVQTLKDAKEHSPDITRVMLTKQQAKVLANYLVKISDGELGTMKKPGFFRRVFG